MDTRSNPTAIQRARQRTGLTLQQFADELGVPLAHAGDVEMHEDEVCMTLNLSQVASLVTRLDIALEAVFPNADFTGSSSGPVELRDRILGFCRTEGLQLAEFEDKAGWEIAKFLQDPSSAVADWNVDCLNDVCQVLGIATEPYLKGMIHAEPTAPGYSRSARNPEP